MQTSGDKSPQECDSNHSNDDNRSNYGNSDDHNDHDDNDDIYDHNIVYNWSEVNLLAIAIILC